MSGRGTTRYRWSRAYGLRFVGMSAVVLGVLWMIAAVLGFPRWSLVALAAAGIVVVASLVRFVVVPPVLLELSVDGYRLRHVRGGGVAAAGWTDVDSVTGGTGDQGSLMVVKLHAGGTTVVPLVLLGPQAVPAERAVHESLNAAFGYRRLGEH
ncbi:MAG: hypothetical protein QOI06_1344 [Nocardioidaceae bacterium]|jgi:hypothetical protein|nr:hypothetical protein [Nocardioidaceae bacterium]